MPKVGLISISKPIWFYGLEPMAAQLLPPKDGRLLLNLGSLYRVQNRLGEAIAYYEQAAAVPEVMPLARYDQFLVSFYQRNFANACWKLRVESEGRK